MLREKIQRVVEHSASSEEAALLIILYLEDKTALSLDGNGWLDNDPKWQVLKGYKGNSKGEDLKKLRQRLEEILA